MALKIIALHLRLSKIEFTDYSQHPNPLEKSAFDGKLVGKRSALSKNIGRHLVGILHILG